MRVLVAPMRDVLNKFNIKMYEYKTRPCAATLCSAPRPCAQRPWRIKITRKCLSNFQGEVK